MPNRSTLRLLQSPFRWHFEFDEGSNVPPISSKTPCFYDIFWGRPSPSPPTLAPGPAPAREAALRRRRLAGPEPVHSRAIRKQRGTRTGARELSWATSDPVAYLGMARSWGCWSSIFGLKHRHGYPLKAFKMT